MPERRLFRFLLLAGLSLAAGFLALAVCRARRGASSFSSGCSFLAGLKLAELIVPETHKSMAWTFGWFLRIAHRGQFCLLLCDIFHACFRDGSFPPEVTHVSLIDSV